MLSVINFTHRTKANNIVTDRWQNSWLQFYFWIIISSSSSPPYGSLAHIRIGFMDEIITKPGVYITPAWQSLLYWYDEIQFWLLSLLLALSPYNIKDQEGSSKYGSNSSDHANDDHLVESSLVY